MEISNSINEPGALNVKLTVSLLIAWVLVYFCIWRGIRTTGKVVYVTATIPYVILVIFFIRGITLPGSIDGIKYYITPQWDRLGDPKVRREIGCKRTRAKAREGAKFSRHNGARGRDD